MTSKEKRLQAIRENPRGVSDRELIGVLMSYDFKVRRAKGSHTVVTHPDLPGFRLTVPRSRRLQRAWVISALNAIDQILEGDK